VHRLAAHTLTSPSPTCSRCRRRRPEAQHLDLYGGVGLFAATIAARRPRTRVTTVESDPRRPSTRGEPRRVGRCARRDRAHRPLPRAAARAGGRRERARLGRGVTLLDPPRAGAGREVVDAVAALAPASVVYVACDPVALARDLGRSASAATACAASTRSTSSRTRTTWRPWRSCSASRDRARREPHSFVGCGRSRRR
jgi:tRNA/tmRNA/rRNA uracil-C5-methylase (TrmA/RlmC/RlmD family)